VSTAAACWGEANGSWKSIAGAMKRLSTHASCKHDLHLSVRTVHPDFIKLCIINRAMRAVVYSSALLALLRLM
jgi:hypothetical protein